MGHNDCEATSTRNVGDRERSGVDILKARREWKSRRQNPGKAGRAGHRMRTEEAGEEACQAGGGSGGGFQGGAVRDRVTNRC